jgi:hypothetical protein
LSALGRHPNKRKLNLYEEFCKHIRGCIASVSRLLLVVSLQRRVFSRGDLKRSNLAAKENVC